MHTAIAFQSPVGHLKHFQPRRVVCLVDSGGHAWSGSVMLSHRYPIYSPQTHSCPRFTFHTMAVISQSPCFIFLVLSNHSSTFYARRHAVKKKQTSEVGANPESRLTLPSTDNVFSLFLLVSLRSLEKGRRCGKSTASCVHLLSWESILKPSVPDAISRVLPSFYHQKNDPF